MQRISAVLIVLIGVFPLWAQHKIEPFNGQEVVANEVLIKFKSVPSDQILSQAKSAQDLDSVEGIGSGDVLKFHSRSKNVAALIRELSARVDVLYVEPNFIMHTTQVPNDTFFSNLWGLKNTGQVIGGVTGKPGADISATSAWDVSTGSRANVVGVVDSGLDYNHVDLAANVWSAPSSFTVTIGGTQINCAAGTHGFNAIVNVCDPLDDNSHGTHVSGTIGAVGNNNQGVVGVNWIASIMGLKFLDSGGSGATSNAINAIEFAIQAKAIFGATANVRVLSNSWGCEGSTCFSQALLDEINKANNNGMLFVAAAGNSGVSNDSNPEYPANYNASNVVAVAATDNTDALASFSNFGATIVHLGAPGVNVYSTLPGGSYGFDSGTSMATPHVSGAAALILSTCGLDTGTLKNTILQNVDVVSSLTGKTITGGRLNVNKAVRACPSTNAGTNSPLNAHINTVATTDETFYLGNDQHVHEIWQSAGIWHKADVTVAAGAPNAVSGSAMASQINTINSTDEVFFFGADQHVHQLWYSGGIWNSVDPTAAAGAPNAASGSSLAVHVNTITNTDEVFYLGTDQHVHQLWQSSGVWHAANPTAAAGAPNAVSGSRVVVQVNTIANTDEVFYLGTDQHVHELWQSAGVWHAADPTAAAGAPNAVSGSSLVAHINTIASTDEVFYLGSDQHVHELWASGGVWHAADPTAAAGAPNAGSGSALATEINTIASTDEVFYVGSDQHVHELWASGGVWHASDPTSAAGGLNALSSSPVVAQINTIATTDEVFYIGTDQHVHQLWFSGGIWHAVDVTAAAGP